MLQMGSLQNSVYFRFVTIRTETSRVLFRPTPDTHWKLKMNPHMAHLRAIRTAFIRLFLTLSLVLSGGIASAMELQSVDSGEGVLLDDLTGNGKWTLVMLWATDCHVCHIDKPEISAFHTKHKDDDAEVIGIALDGITGLDKVKDYIADNKPSFPSYVADIAIIASHYYSLTEENLRGTPTYLLFSPEGELLGNNPGRLSVEAIENFIARKSEATG